MKEHLFMYLFFLLMCMPTFRSLLICIFMFTFYICTFICILMCAIKLGPKTCNTNLDSPLRALSKLE